MTQQHTAPVDYLSYSSMTQLMNNPLAFKKSYILKIFDNKTGVAGVVGSAGHKALEEYYKGMEPAAAIAEGLRYIKNNASTVDWGKTGTIEKANEKYTRAINWYFEEMPTYHKILGVEMSIVDKMTRVDGKGDLPLPGKVKIDLVTENIKGEIEIVDHKFVSSFSDGDVDVFSHLMQAMFTYHLVLAEFGRPPARMIFNELKTSENTKENKGKPQLQPYTIEFEGAYGDFATFYHLFNDVVRFISNPDAIYLPNPRDIFDGQASFEAYRLGVIDSDQVVQVSHKTEQRAFEQKKNYVPSAFDRVENENFTPEARIAAKLVEFGITADMKETIIGPSTIQYQFTPGRGASMAKIAKLNNDIALALSAKKVRIEAPIRGTSLVGIEVANPNRQTVELGKNHMRPGTTMIPVGVDVRGEVHYADIVDMPHLLIAGQTGAGKSVMLNVILESLTTQMTPDDLKLVLIDPKQVELAMYEGDPHVLGGEIITETDTAVDALGELVAIMETRYTMLREKKVRKLDDYNKLKGVEKLEKIVVVIDEFADLMMSGGQTKEKAQYAEITERDMFGKPIRKFKEKIADEKPSVETMIVRLGQKARAVGIHLIIATQRPSVDVVTGLIKANIPTKIAFAVTNQVNSKIILDETGAEELTGKGDMLFTDPNTNEIIRLQGLYA